MTDKAGILNNALGQNVTLSVGLGGNVELLPCPFCGEVPSYPDGIGTQYEMWCDCGMACSCVQISDLMTLEERNADPFIDYKYSEEYVERAKREVTRMWNERVPHNAELTRTDDEI